MGNQQPDGSPEDFAAIVELAEHFGALVDALHGGTQTGLDPKRIVALAKRSMPGSHEVGIVAWRDGRLRTVASTSSVLERLDEIRVETGEGPALDAIDGNDLVISGDVAEDPRWPEFGSRATDRTGIRSLATYRLFLSRRHRGALTFCSSWPHGFTDFAIEIGAIFGAFCSLSILTELMGDDAVSAYSSTDVHREIGVAIGIVMSTTGVESAEAYHRLRTASRQMRRSLPETAGHVIREGRLST